MIFRRVAKCQWSRTGWWASTFISRDISTPSYPVTYQQGWQKHSVAISTHYLYQTAGGVYFHLWKRFPLVDSSEVPWLRAVSCNSFPVGIVQRGCRASDSKRPKCVFPEMPPSLSLLMKLLGLSRGAPLWWLCLILIGSPRPHIQTTQIKFLLPYNPSQRSRSILMNPWETHTTSEHPFLIPPWLMSFSLK